MELELTVHGSERIHGRTKMTIKDVLSVIENGAVVTLGETTECEYLLFYSPPDHCTKIAVVAAKRTYLISIWERDYFLPEGVSRPNKQRDRKAREVLSRFLFKRGTTNKTV